MIDRPVRRRHPMPSTTTPTRYAAVWPMPSAATRAAPCVTRLPTIITATPSSAEPIATIAGVRLSPSA